MDIYGLLVFFVLGTVLGSFFIVVGLRLPQGISFSSGRSACPGCEHQLSWTELLPVISFICQRGKCRHCWQRISLIYPLIELSTGLLFAFAYWYFGFVPELIMAVLLISLLMIVFVTDITYMLIPNNVLVFFLPFILVMRMVSQLTPWYDALIGAGVGLVVLGTIIVVSRGGMGAGDMKLFGVIGVVLGWQATLLTLFVAAFLGAMIGSAIIVIQKTDRKQPIPFGPYIVLAALLSYFYGGDIITFYQSLFV